MLDINTTVKNADLQNLKRENKNENYCLCPSSAWLYSNLSSIRRFPLVNENETCAA